MHLEPEPSQDPSLPPLSTTSTIITVTTTTTTTTSSTTPSDPAPVTLQTFQIHKPQDIIDNSDNDPLNQKPKHLYFAYGSNLSPTQMRLRCIHNPELSAHPVALAALDSWRWLICQFGYANVVPPSTLRIGKQIAEGDDVPESISESIPAGGVYGVLYEMSGPDERVLDGYEGVDHEVGFPPPESKVKVPVEVRPREQGAGLYNKWYVDARVVEWLDEGYRERTGFAGVGGEVRVLVYVDEERVRVAAPKDEYVPRMNRAIREAVGLGFPGDWVERVMRRAIPESE
ncbi:hypothetical protein BJY04DRAFT_223964 [Aspergillus karnatakaensis]|uniref:gamma-glutamylcyclotransferase family protein n=1 Tax=Aspergillus karnatakaensis TaxID=1810916 RepID=UPI003CCD2AA8